MNKFLFSIFFLVGICLSQNTYLPLKVNNEWHFRTKSDCIYKIQNDFSTMTVLRDTIISDHQYFKVNLPTTWYGWLPSPKYLRYDSLSNKIMKYPINYTNIDSDLVFLDFNAFDVDDSTEVFGEKKRFKGYWLSDMPGFYIEFAENFGPIYIYHNDRYQGYGCITYFYIKYAYVNDILYGDTTTTITINEQNNHITYSLGQNYPNPFNSKSKIPFTIPQNEFVELNIYNIKGQLVKEVLAEDMQIGKHYAEVDMSGLASGIYIYQLKVGQFIESKKLILVN